MGRKCGINVGSLATKRSNKRRLLRSVDAADGGSLEVLC